MDLTPPELIRQIGIVPLSWITHQLQYLQSVDYHAQSTTNIYIFFTLKNEKEKYQAEYNFSIYEPPFKLFFILICHFINH